MPGFSAIGSPSKTTFFDMESHKLCLEFVVGATAVKKGQPVKLEVATGKIIPWAKADLAYQFVGVALTDGAIGDNVTIMTRGFMVIFALTSAALNAGIATYQSYDAATVESVITGGTKGYPVFGPVTAAAESTEPNGWNLDVQAGANLLTRILIRD